MAAPQKSPAEPGHRRNGRGQKRLRTGTTGTTGTGVSGERMTGWWFGTWLLFFHFIYGMSSYVILPIDELIYFSRLFFNHQPDDFVETLGHHGGCNEFSSGASAAELFVLTRLNGVSLSSEIRVTQCHFDRSGTGISTSISMFPNIGQSLLPQIIDTPHFL